MKTRKEDGQLSLFGQDGYAGKMCPAHSAAGRSKGQTSSLSYRRSLELKAVPFLSLDLTPGHGNLLGEFYWELLSPWLGGSSMLNTGPAPLKEEDVYSLSQILQDDPPPKYYLSRTACLGILRRAKERGKRLPPQLELALKAQAGLISLEELSASLLISGEARRKLFDGDCLNPWDTQQARIFTPEGKAPTLASADGGGGRNPGGLLFASGVVSKGNGDCFLLPERHASLSGGGGQAGQGYPCVLTAAFNAGAGSAAGTIGYKEEIAPTLKGSASGNMMPSVLCLNDQGGSIMECSEEVAGTLRAQEHGHQPLVLGLYENHGIDARYTGPHPVSPTLPAHAGTGGNNLPLVSAMPETLCLLGNTVDCAPENGGHGLGVQEELAYTLTSEHRHAVFTRQRTDHCTESARQYKDATDLIYQAAHRAATEAIAHKCAAELPMLIRRLTPLECERLQGFPDGWTDIPGASDSARYKALGNSVAIPCVEFVMRGIAMAVGESVEG